MQVTTPGNRIIRIEIFFYDDVPARRLRAVFSPAIMRWNGPRHLRALSGTRAASDEGRSIQRHFSLLSRRTAALAGFFNAL